MEWLDSCELLTIPTLPLFQVEVREAEHRLYIASQCIEPRARHHLPAKKRVRLSSPLLFTSINTFDVADAYSNGRSEEIVGAFLRKYDIPRLKIVIMSKLFFNVYPAGTVVKVIEKHVIDAVDASVKRLGIYIDVLQTHRIDLETPKEEIMRALSDVVDSGKARYISGSTMAIWQFQMCQNVAEKNGRHKFISMQGLYNLLYCKEEREMNDYCRATSVGLFPWSPLLAGVLVHAWEDRTDERENSDNIVNCVEEIAKKKGVPMAQIAIACVISKGGIMPIMGLTTKEQIDQAVQVLFVKLTEEECQYLEELYVPRAVIGH
ncbi:Aldo/keto reductase [Cadophora sp. DSE1049]|nr:Aldo/keto reductase [Cadophora sp. DSE1049]